MEGRIMAKVFSVVIVLIVALSQALPVGAQTSELNTSYVTMQAGLTYAGLLGGRNFGWRYTSPYGSNHIGMLRFNDLGSGTAGCGGVRVLYPVSRKFGIVASLQDIRLITTASESRTLTSSDEIAGTLPARITSAYQDVWQYTSGELLLRYAVLPWLYSFGGADVGVLADDSFDGAEQLLSDGSFLSFKTGKGTGERLMSLSSYYSVKYYEPLRVAAKFGIGTMLPMPLFHSWIITPELAVSIPVTPLFNRTARDLYAKDGIGIPNLFYTSFTISVGLPLADEPDQPTLTTHAENPVAPTTRPIEKPAVISRQQKVAGSIREESTTLPLAATITATDLALGKTIATMQTDASGHFSIALTAPGKYSLTAEAPGHLFHSIAITLKADEDDEDATLAPIELSNTTTNTQGKVSLLVFFGFDNAMLSAESYPELQRVTTLLRNSPSMEIEIGGHTDAEGADEYNQQLSAKRALAVKNYLVLQGIAVTRISAVGYGKTKPIADNDSDEGRAKNRRVEMVIKAGQVSAKK
jgi:outer membrane protein OmpA-like peptidoglycan-associated protein